jgi:hypothetical protein
MFASSRKIRNDRCFGGDARMTIVEQGSAHDYSGMSTIPIAPWASVCFPLYRAPRSSSGTCQRFLPDRNDSVVKGWNCTWRCWTTLSLVFFKNLNFRWTTERMVRHRSLIRLISNQLTKPHSECGPSFGAVPSIKHRAGDRFRDVLCSDS